ncbi:MAG: hypothetical protein AAFQ63_11460 [Cyanobacteria bacterium J06621_11]
MIEKFEQVTPRSEFVEYYGEFNGRYNHVGSAVTADGQFEYAQFCLPLAEEGLDAIALKRPLIDQQGYGQIYSWRQDLFKS